MAQADSVVEVVEDLKLKIENLKNIGDNVDDKAMQKINDIKQKAIYVLSQASDKIVQSADNLSSADEIEKAVEIIKVKSKELYDNAMNRINNLLPVEEVKEEVLEEVKEEVLEEVKVEVEETKIEEVVQEVKQTKEEFVIEDELTYEAISVLKDWLKER